jgi:hypothetical protein
MPITSERRPISRLTRSSGLVLRSLDQWSPGKAYKASRSVSAVSSSSATFWCRTRELVDDLAEALARFVVVGGVEELADRARNQWLLGLADVPEHVAGEVHGAALPWAAEDLRDRVLEALVRV